MVSTFLYNEGSILSYDSNQNITNPFHEKGHKAFALIGCCYECLSISTGKTQQPSESTGASDRKLQNSQYHGQIFQSLMEEMEAFWRKQLTLSSQ